MRVLIAETLYPHGHVVLNELFVKTIAMQANVILVDSGNYFSDKTKSYCDKVIKLKHLEPFGNELVFFICYLINYFILALRLLYVKYDKIVFLSLRTDAFYFAHRFFRKDSIIVVHHNDIDRMLSRKYELRLFSRYKNDVRHVVLADFIKEGLELQVGINTGNVYTVYQPIAQEYPIDFLKQTDRSNIIAGISSSIDKVFIRKLSDILEKSNVNLKNRLVIKTGEIEYNNDNIQTFNHYLTRDEFDRILFEAKACLAIYPESYNLRYSGLIDDALSHGLIVICNDIKVSKFFKAKYPKSIIIIKGADDLIKIASETMPEVDYVEIEQFYRNHSYCNVAKQWAAVLS